MSRFILLGICLTLAGCSVRSQGKQYRPPDPVPPPEPPTVTLHYPVFDPVPPSAPEPPAVTLNLPVIPQATSLKAELPPVRPERPMVASVTPNPEPEEVRPSVTVASTENQREPGLRDFLESTYYLTAGPLLLLTTITVAFCMRRKSHS